MTTTQTILITGATSGIGRHAALYLAERGYRVFATGRAAGALAVLLEEARARGIRAGAELVAGDDCSTERGADGTGSLETLVLDVTDADSIASAVDEVDRRTGGRGLDVLVNNAGYGATGPLEMMTDADLRAQFDVNVFGLMAVTRAFVGAMRERGAGRIVNVSSLGGTFSFPLFGAYTASKFALEAMSDALRVELAPFGVRVVVIQPGPIDTGFSDRSIAEVGKYRDDASVYAPVIARANAIKRISDRQAVTPDCISRAIHKAIRSRRPRARYAAPLGASLAMAALRALPTRVSDWLLGMAVGLRRSVLVPGPASPRALSREISGELIVPSHDLA